jgi:hypothetical protein
MGTRYAANRNGAVVKSLAFRAEPRQPVAAVPATDALVTIPSERSRADRPEPILIESARPPVA